MSGKRTATWRHSIVPALWLNILALTCSIGAPSLLQQERISLWKSRSVLAGCVPFVPSDATLETKSPSIILPPAPSHHARADETVVCVRTALVRPAAKSWIKRSPKSGGGCFFRFLAPAAAAWTCSGSYGSNGSRSCFSWQTTVTQATTS